MEINRREVVLFPFGDSGDLLDGELICEVVDDDAIVRVQDEQLVTFYKEYRAVLCLVIPCNLGEPRVVPDKEFSL